MGSIKNSWVIPLLIMAIALLIRYPLIHTGTPFYSSDTAILDLMARHFAKGEFSVYYWGERYYGVLDPLLLVPLFKFFGYGPLVSQRLPYIFTITFLWMYHRFLKETTDHRTAQLATLILAVGSPYFLGATFTTYNYILSLNFGMLFLLMFERIANRKMNRWFVFAFGAVMGLSWYYLQLVLLFWQAAIIPIAVSKQLWKEFSAFRESDCPSWLKKLLVLITVGNAINVSVAIVLWFHGDWIGTVHGHTVKLFCGPIVASSVQLTGLTLAIAYWKRILSLMKRVNDHVPLAVWGFGFLVGYSPALLGYVLGRPAASGGGFPTLHETAQNVRVLLGDIFPLMFESSPNALLKWCVILVFLGGMGTLCLEVRKKNIVRLHSFVVLAVVNLFLCVFYAKLGHGNERYLLPFYVGLPLGIVWFLKRVVKQPIAVSLLLGIFLISNGIANEKLLLNGPRPARYAKLADYLVEHHIQGGYADYWMAYETTALSNENVILAPLKDYDRYKPYLDYVRSLDKVIVLGEPPQPLNSFLTIKGTPYRVIGVDHDSGLPIMFIKKAT